VGYLKVVDVSELPRIYENEWTAIVVLHTWEYGKPQADAAAFVARVGDKRKLIVVTTSGGGKQKMPGTDAISTASERRDVPTRVAEAMRTMDAILKKNPPAVTSPRADMPASKSLTVP